MIQRGQLLNTKDIHIAVKVFSTFVIPWWTSKAFVQMAKEICYLKYFPRQRNLFYMSTYSQQIKLQSIVSACE